MTASLPASLDAACAKMKGAGLRITQPRLAILAQLIKRGAPASIEQIHSEVGASRCDLVTVYRCMAAFEGIALVRRAFFLNGSWLYAIDLGGAPRYHVVCRASDRVEEIDAESGAALTSALESAEAKLRARGYTETGHIVEFFGIAPVSPRTQAGA